MHTVFIIYVYNNNQSDYFSMCVFMKQQSPRILRNNRHIVYFSKKGEMNVNY